eukprot:2044325-Pyramimonas_sp.AAC.1
MRRGEGNAKEKMRELVSSCVASPPHPPPCSEPCVIAPLPRSQPSGRPPLPAPPSMPRPRHYSSPCLCTSSSSSAFAASTCRRDGSARGA